MKVDLESSLTRWVQAQLLDEQQAQRIRDYESTAAPPARSQLPLLIGLALGGIMLAAGLLLFVSAHWDQMSPVQRMSTLIAGLAALHIGGALSAPRFRAMSVTLHAVGTVLLGGAILLAGQIFNMQEHWPAAILMWAVGATLGALLIRDWAQFALAAILIPFWLVSEWLEALSHSNGANQIATAFVVFASFCYLSVRDRGTRTAALTWIGGIALLPAILILCVQGSDTFFGHSIEFTTVEAVYGWTGALLIPLVFAFIYRGARVWMNAVAGLWVYLLTSVVNARAELGIYGLCAVGAAGLIAWGIHERRPERINLGMAGFFLNLIFFFFSSVMDKLGRSLSLIALGAVLLAGGWYAERLRRRFVARAIAGGVQ